MQAKSTLVVQGTKQLPKCIENTDKNSGMVNIPVPQSTKVGETSTDEKDSAFALYHDFSSRKVENKFIKKIIIIFSFD
jgi:hypothetical protein